MDERTSAAVLDAVEERNPDIAATEQKQQENGENCHAPKSSPPRCQNFSVVEPETNCNTESSATVSSVVLVEAGYAKIKPQYLCPPGNDTKSVCSGSELSDKKTVKPRHVRGQNKNRKKAKRPADSDQICPTLISTGEKFGECKFGPKKCRFMHDFEEYLKKKPEDIRESGLCCPFFDVRGRCPFGISCRFAGQHFNFDSLQSITDEPKWESWKQQTFPARLTFDCRFIEQNSVSTEIQKLLRRGKYDFGRSETYLKNLQDKKMVSSEENDKIGFVSDEDTVKVRTAERKQLDWFGKRYLSPLTTVGNLPFRRICVELGAEITCSEMVVATALLQGTQSEWSLVKRHDSEKLFGVQLCGSHSNTMMKACQVLAEQTQIDFVDVNLGCPIDLICNKGAGCSLMTRASRLNQILDSMHHSLEPTGTPLTVKLRTGLQFARNTAHTLLARLKDDSRQCPDRVALYTLHGRSKEQRYTKLANWAYIHECAGVADPVPLFGCGDVLSFEDYYRELERENSKIFGVMIGRGALIKPWIFTEIEEKRHWDISSSERLDILRKYVKYGLEHWGSDQQGVEKTRSFLLEWISFLHRYIPVGVLERMPQKINEQPPRYFGRDDLETLMCSSRSSDWVKISELLLGPVPKEFEFVPKHKANSY